MKNSKKLYAPFFLKKNLKIVTQGKKQGEKIIRAPKLELVLDGQFVSNLRNPKKTSIFEHFVSVLSIGAIAKAFAIAVAKCNF